MAKMVHRLADGDTPSDVPPGGELTTPEAIELGEYRLILSDLRASLWALGFIQKGWDGISLPTEVHEALFRDAVVQFVACFDTPGQASLSSEAVFGADADDERNFRYIRGMRDSYAAHRFGPQRQSFILISLIEQGFGIGEYKVTFSMPALESLPKYEHVVGLAIAAAEAREAELLREVSAQVTALGPEGIAKLSPPKVRSPKPEEHRMSRKTFRAGGPPGRGRRGQWERKP